MEVPIATQPNTQTRSWGKQALKQPSLTEQINANDNQSIPNVFDSLKEIASEKKEEKTDSFELKLETQPLAKIIAQEGFFNASFASIIASAKEPFMQQIVINL